MFAPRVRPIDGATAGVIGDAVVVELGVEDEHPRSARATQKLVWRKVNGIQVLKRIIGPHIDVDVGCRASKIDEAQTIVLMHQLGDFVIRGLDACHVGTRGDR